MTDADLAELERVCNAATAGPWFVNQRTGEICHGDPDRDSDNYPLDTVADDEFIIAARAALPLLIAEVRELRDKLDDANEEAHRLHERVEDEL